MDITLLIVNLPFEILNNQLKQFLKAISNNCLLIGLAQHLAENSTKLIT